MPGSVQDVLHSLAYLILTGPHDGGFVIHPHFTDEETEAQGSQGSFPQAHSKKRQSQGTG